MTASTLAVERPVPLRVRPELAVLAIEGKRGARCWRIKDPLALEYFQLEDEEYAILTMLDGRTSLAEIRRRFEQRYAPQHLSLGQLQAYLSHLHAEGLALADTPDQGRHLLERKKSSARRGLAAALINPLAIRFRGFDPGRFLDWLSPRCRWLFSRWAAALALVVVGFTLVFVVGQFERISLRLPELKSFLTPAGLLWLSVALGGAKVLHELGHALVCRRYGGECHEMGLLLLVFTPCLYCNVSDAWMMPGKWPRVAISAAGIVVELLLASVCLWLWWFSQPGMLNSIFLDVVLVCSIGTVVFNGNPLLKYDGYYVLSDALEVPNLAEQSHALVRRLAWGWLARDGSLAHPHERLSRSARRWLVTYAVLSGAYRVFVMAMILWFCWSLFAAWNLKVLGGGFVTVVLAGMAVPPLVRGVQFLRDPVRRREADPVRLRWTLAAGLLLLGALFLVPVPQRVSADLVLQPAGENRVHVTVPGRLVRAVTAGTEVAAGDPLAELDSAPLRREIDKLQRDCDMLALRCRNLDSRRAEDAEAAAAIPAAAEELDHAKQRLAQRLDDQRRLGLRAPAAGVVFPPADVPEPVQRRQELAGWSRTPLEPRNVGSWLDAGTVLCSVGRPREFEALLVIGQSEIELVTQGQLVRLSLDQLPGRVVEGTVAEVAAVNLESIPAELVGSRDTAVLRDKTGALKPAETSYQARVTIAERDLPVSVRARGRAKIRVGSVPLGQQLYRLVRQTFHFKL
ncbi:MAG: HlyD family efflux transporter periplasmic adaptor subunit [Planctomycetia bacterium]|nr:HlyD family efflux transporter periplasmic adaptor subunit [Planctomycetia bacterium]